MFKFVMTESSSIVIKVFFVIALSVTAINMTSDKHPSHVDHDVLIAQEEKTDPSPVTQVSEVVQEPKIEEDKETEERRMIFEESVLFNRQLPRGAKNIVLLGSFWCTFDLVVHDELLGRDITCTFLYRRSGNMHNRPVYPSIALISRNPASVQDPPLPETGVRSP